MKKYLLLNLTLSTFLCTAIITPSLSTSLEAGKNIEIQPAPAIPINIPSLDSALDPTLTEQIRQKYPVLFTGEKQFLTQEDLQNIFKFAEEQNKRPDGYLEETAFGPLEPSTFLNSFITKLPEFWKDFNFEKKDSMIEDVNRYAQAQNVSVNLLLLTILRGQAALSSVSDDEKDLYTHIPRPAEELMEGLKHWHNDISTISGLFRAKDARQSSLGEFYANLGESFSYEVISGLNRAIDKSLPLHFWFPICGHSYLGIHYMIDNITQNRHLMAVSNPDQPKRAHGVEMSDVGFSVHDLLHYLADGRITALKKTAQSLLKEAYDQGYDYEDVLPLITKRVTQHYHLTHYSLRVILNGMNKLVLDNKLSQEEYFKALAGFIWVLNETPNAFEGAYTQTTITDLMNSLHSHSTTNLKADAAWENSTDYFTTSPLDGSPFLTDGEIIEGMLKNIPSLEKFFIGEKWMHPTFTKEQIKKVEVKSSKRFVDIFITLRIGAKLQYSVPTLYHKHTNGMDNARFLKWAGVKNLENADTPLPNNSRQARDASIKMLKSVEAGLTEVLDAWKKVATQISETEHPQIGRLDTWYKNTWDAIQQEYGQSLNQLKKAN